MTDEEFAEMLGLNLELSRKYDIDYGDEATYYYFLSKTVDEEIFKGSLNIPEPIEIRESKNLDGQTGWVIRRFRFLSGCHYQKLDSTYKMGKELFGLASESDLKSQLPILLSFRNAYLDQLVLQGNAWVKIQERIANVLKVYYLESTSNGGNPHSKIRELFNELLDNPPLDKITELLKPLSDEFISEQVLYSVKIGIEWNAFKKESIIEQSIHLAEKYFVSEILIQFAITKSNIELKEALIKQTREINSPDLTEVALQIVKSSNSRYPVGKIISALEITKRYIIDEELDDLRNHISNIIRQCLIEYGENKPNDKTIRNWIQHYCKKAGIPY